MDEKQRQEEYGRKRNENDRILYTMLLYQAWIITGIITNNGILVFKHTRYS